MFLACERVLFAMPELPEIETLCRQLCATVLHEEIVGFHIFDEKIKITGDIVGKRIVSATREGKSLVITLDDGVELILRLRMTGRLLWQTHPDAHRHTRFMIFLRGGVLSCIDPRRFATLTFLKNSSYRIRRCDPMDTSSVTTLYESVRARKVPVKTFLMDQNVIEGIGNIYACEILHEAAISPLRKTCEISLEEWERIARLGRDILMRAIECRGSSVSDWRDLFGRKGHYQGELKVYKRNGQPCFRCGNIVIRVPFHGRGTYFCPSCQG